MKIIVNIVIGFIVGCIFYHYVAMPYVFTQRARDLSIMKYSSGEWTIDPNIPNAWDIKYLRDGTMTGSLK
jgi:hypothetical protein